MKHIGVQYHFVQDACERNAIRTSYLPTSEMTADIMMKSLPRETHWMHVNKIGMVVWASGGSICQAGGAWPDKLSFLWWMCSFSYGHDFPTHPPHI